LRVVCTWNRIIDLKVDSLMFNLGGSASDSSNYSDLEFEDDVESDDQLSGIEDLA
jgi:hypothetical protein